LRFWPSRMPGWRPGVRDRASRTAGCPLPCCRKAKRGARTPICCGTQPCGSAPMLKARAEQCASGNRGAGMTPNNPVLPAQGRGGADCPCPNPMACVIEHPRGRADLSALSTLLQAGGFDQVDVEAAALITASARYWTSRTTCLSDSRSFSAPAVVKRVAALCGTASKAERGTWTVRTPAAEDRGFPSRHQHSFPTAYSH
jgi:hypothetical protein